MQREIRTRYKGEVQLVGIVSKNELTNLFINLIEGGETLDEFHFIGHSGMYGPMYGTVAYPEQLSPYEWKTLNIPFAENAKAFFHCCRSARWFAPFFAREFGVETFGYHWYTAFSADSARYRRISTDTKVMYAKGCIGRKSHGLKGSVRKHLGVELEQLKSFHSVAEPVDRTYDRVAELYDNVFQDIKVRRDEWRWLAKRLPDMKGKTMADIGCGNGALLKELSMHVDEGIGLDISEGILNRARMMNSDCGNISFRKLEGPILPLGDQSVDVFVSLLSFRYLDWDPLMDEIRRVLRPGGRVLIIDMITVPAKFREYPFLLNSKLRHYLQRYTHRTFYKNLETLVSHPDWKEMLKHNPIRAEHEMKWYLESRFPGRKTEKINIGWNSSILAFDSGPIEQIKNIQLTYP